VNDQLGILDEAHELLRDIAESRFIRKEAIAQPVHSECTGVDRSLRIQIVMEMATGKPSIQEFYRANFDDAMTLTGFEPGGLCIQYDLSHGAPRSVSIAALAA
jgi:hypothetical protein